MGKLKSKSAINLRKILAPALTLGLALNLAPGLAAANVDVTGVTPPVTGGDMDDAVSAVNGANQSAATIVVTISGTEPAGTSAGLVPVWLFKGAGTNGIGTITFSGGIPGSARAILQGNATGKSNLMVIQDAANSSINNLVFQNSHSQMAYSTTIRGGALYITNAAGGATAMNNVLFDSNSISLTESSALGGGFALNYLSAGGASQGSATLTGVDLSGNKALMTSTYDSAVSGFHSAIGGGARFLGVETVTYSNSTISGNLVQAIFGSHAHGGGLAVEGDAMTGAFNKLTFSGNTAQVNDFGYDPDGSVARGGAFYALSQDQTAAASTLTFDADTAFTDNKAIAIGDGTAAMGGAVSFLGNVAGKFSGQFTNNLADASQGVAAYGGAIATAGFFSDPIVGTDPVAQLLTLDGAVFSGNKAVAASHALGGAIYAEGDVLIENSTLTNNEANAAANSAFGGAVYFSTTVQGSDTRTVANLTLKADGGNVLIQGNKANGVASGLYFGGTGASELDVRTTAAGDSVNMLDPITVVTSAAFTLTNHNTFAGGFVWGGSNLFNLGDNPATFAFDNSRVDFASDFSASSSDADTEFVLSFDGATIRIDPTRYYLGNTALFDIADADMANSTISITGGKIDFLSNKSLLDLNGDLVLVTSNNAAATALAAYLNGSGALGAGVTAKAVGDNVVLTVNLKSDEQAKLARFANTWSAGLALQTLVAALPDDSPLLPVIKANYGAMTGEYAPAAGFANTMLTYSIAESAISGGLGGWAPDRQGARPWLAYVGGFNGHDGSDDFLGYASHANGVLVGVNYDFNLGSAGGYFAYTRGKLTMDDIKSEVTADGLHFGVQAAVMPVEKLGIYGDFAYSHYDNQGFRAAEAYRSDGSFDQDVYSFGLRARYEIWANETLSFAPYAELRYLGLNTDDFTETGDLTPTLLQGGKTSSLFTSLGASLNFVVPTDNGSVKPYLYVGWKHEYLDNSIIYTANYLDVPGVTFDVSTANFPANSFELGGGVGAMFNMSNGSQLGFNLSVDANLAKSYRGLGVFGGLEYRF